MNGWFLLSLRLEREMNSAWLTLLINRSLEIKLHAELRSTIAAHFLTGEVLIVAFHLLLRLPFEGRAHGREAFRLIEVRRTHSI